MESVEKKFKRTTVTAALPYTNGPVHIGHLAGVYLPADIYVRYLRNTGKEVLFVCGSDEHGVPITIRARQEGISPQQLVDKYNEIIRHSFEQFNISFDIYSRTSAEVHHKTASDFFLKLYKDGSFIEQVTSQFYDDTLKQFLADRYITGTCPHCHNDRAYGDQCEKCGTSLNPTDLINPKSALTGNTPVLKDTRHWFLPLDKYQGKLEDWILKSHKEWKSNVYGQCKSWLDQGLQPRAVTRDLDWGVPVPLENAEGKVLYVWFDAPIGYISATKDYYQRKNGSEQGWEKHWKDEETRLIHFIGKDNIVFHCIIFPTMLMAHGDFILPDNVPAFEFLNLEGEKISTSRNWAVWLDEYIKDFPDKTDVLRYVLCATAPETKDNDFTWKDFQARNNNELVAILGNFVNRTLVLTEKYFNSVVPKPGEFGPEDKLVLDAIKEAPGEISSALENFRFRDALGAMMNLARAGNKYLADTEPWKLIKTDEARVATILNISLQVCACLTEVMEPFLPESSRKLAAMLQFAAKGWNADLIRMQAGHALGKSSLLFEKIGDEVIEAELQKLELKKAGNKVQVKEPLKAETSFEEFSKMDIRVGVITEAEKVPKTQKLLKLQVDTGIDKRTIVSGIAEYFEPENIIGQKVSVLVNLAPRKIKGIESQGMILMAEDSTGKLGFVFTPDIEPGSVIR